MIVRTGHAQLPAAGESVCGDALVIVDLADTTLIALADGLGHGADAAEPAQRFCQHVESNSTLPLDELLRGADEALRNTRGAAAALVRIDRGSARLSYAGVGNVDLRATSAAPIAATNTTGILGRRIGRVLVQSFALAVGDVIVLYSDGVSSRADLTLTRGVSPQAAADLLLTRYRKPHDDATCVVVRIEHEVEP